MYRNSNASIKNDADFEDFLKGYSEVKSFDELNDLAGARIRYKTTHFYPNGQHEVQYRLGGLCTFVDKNLEYFRLKNLNATKSNNNVNSNSNNNYSNTWSVQLKTKKLNHDNETCNVPVIPSWVVEQNISGVSKVIKQSKHGVMVLHIWYFKPDRQEVHQLRELVARLQKESNDNKFTNNQTQKHKAGSYQTNDTNNNRKTQFTSNSYKNNGNLETEVRLKTKQSSYFF